MTWESYRNEPVANGVINVILTSILSQHIWLLLLLLGPRNRSSSTKSLHDEHVRRCRSQRWRVLWIIEFMCSTTFLCDWIDWILRRDSGESFTFFVSVCIVDDGLTVFIRRCWRRRCSWRQQQRRQWQFQTYELRMIWLKKIVEKFTSFNTKWKRFFFLLSNQHTDQCTRLTSLEYYTRTTSVDEVATKFNKVVDVVRTSSNEHWRDEGNVERNSSQSINSMFFNSFHIRYYGANGIHCHAVHTSHTIAAVTTLPTSHTHLSFSVYLQMEMFSIGTNVSAKQHTHTFNCPVNAMRGTNSAYID